MSAEMSTAAKRPGNPGDGPAAKKKPKLPIVNDYESWAEAKAEAWASGKEDMHATLKALGFPPDLGFESWKKKQHEEAGTFVKEKDLPAWCFLQTEPKRQLCISMDGKNVNTLFMVRKRRVLETEMAFGKPLKVSAPFRCTRGAAAGEGGTDSWVKMTILDSTKEKVGVRPEGTRTAKCNDAVRRTPPGTDDHEGDRAVGRRPAPEGQPPRRAQLQLHRRRRQHRYMKK